MTSHESATNSGHDSTPSADSLPGILARAFGQLREDPVLGAPFVVAGIVLTLLDELRRRDPVPARSTDLADGTELSVDILVTPTGSQATTRTLGALVDLQPRLLAWALGLEVVGVVTVALASYLALARALDTPLSATSAGMYLLYASLGSLWYTPAGTLVEFEFDAGFGVLLLLLPLFVVSFFIVVRLFVVPAALVDGAGILVAVRQSNAAVRGRSWSVFGLFVVLGVLSWAVGVAPVGSTLLSWAVVVLLHALAIAVVYESRTVSA